MNDYVEKTENSLVWKLAFQKSNMTPNHQYMNKWKETNCDHSLVDFSEKDLYEQVYKEGFTPLTCKS